MKTSKRKANIEVFAKSKSMSIAKQLCQNFWKVYSTVHDLVNVCENTTKLMLDEITMKKILFALLAFMDDLDQPKLVSVTINTRSDHVKFERSHTHSLWKNAQVKAFFTTS